MGYQKAIAALLTNLSVLAVAIGMDTSWLTPELTASLSTVLSTVFVYAIRNR